MEMVLVVFVFDIIARPYNRIL